MAASKRPSVPTSLSTPPAVVPCSDLAQRARLPPPRRGARARRDQVREPAAAATPRGGAGETGDDRSEAGPADECHPSRPRVGLLDAHRGRLRGLPPARGPRWNRGFRGGRHASSCDRSNTECRPLGSRLHAQLPRQPATALPRLGQTLKRGLATGDRRGPRAARGPRAPADAAADPQCLLAPPRGERRKTTRASRASSCGSSACWIRRAGCSTPR
jgi:hypothetical protein